MSRTFCMLTSAECSASSFPSSRLCWRATRCSAASLCSWNNKETFIIAICLLCESSPIHSQTIIIIIIIKAQWLGRRSLADGLSLICAWSMVDVTTSWARCPLWVNQSANSAFHPFWVGKWVVIQEVETIQRQAGTAYSCLAVRLARVCQLSLQSIGCTSSLACDEQRYGSFSFR